MFDFIKNLIVELIVDTFLFYTGEMVLYILTFGKKKIRWDTYVNDRPRKFILYYYATVWVGFFFWLFVILFILKFFL